VEKFIQKHEQNISGTLSCVDRIVFKGYLPVSWADSFGEDVSAHICAFLIGCMEKFPCSLLHALCFFRFQRNLSGKEIRRAASDVPGTARPAERLQKVQIYRQALFTKQRGLTAKNLWSLVVKEAGLRYKVSLLQPHQKPTGYDLKTYV